MPLVNGRSTWLMKTQQSNSSCQQSLKSRFDHWVLLLIMSVAVSIVPRRCINRNLARVPYFSPLFRFLPTPAYQGLSSCSVRTHWPTLLSFDDSSAYALQRKAPRWAIQRRVKCAKTIPRLSSWMIFTVDLSWKCSTGKLFRLPFAGMNEMGASENSGKRSVFANLEPPESFNFCKFVNCSKFCTDFGRSKAEIYSNNFEKKWDSWDVISSIKRPRHVSAFLLSICKHF